MTLESGDRRAITTKPERGHTMGKTKVRTTLEPGTVIKVDERELTDLSRMGVLHSHEDSAAASSLGLVSKREWRDDEPETATETEAPAKAEVETKKGGK